jgi:hypothetical protein
MTQAMEKAGRAREEIGYVNYHGTSTQLNDAVESRCTLGEMLGPVRQHDDHEQLERTVVPGGVELGDEPDFGSGGR